VSIPLAALLALGRKRPRHVLIGHRLSPRKKKVFMRALQSQMDAIFVYAASQKAYAEKVLGIPPEKIHLIPFHGGRALLPANARCEDPAAHLERRSGAARLPDADRGSA